MTVQYPTIADCVGNTPLVRLQRLPGETSNTLLVKLEGNNPAGSVKDRPALSMITRAELRGDIRPGDTLIEATSGNTGIALAMAAAIKGYKMILIMPDNSTAERKAAMTAYGAELILVSKEEGMEGARDLADKLQREGRGKVLDQFANGDNPEAHYHSTGPEIWQQTGGSITHFVSSMGTTGTIMGVSRYLKEQNPAVQIVGLDTVRHASFVHAHGSSTPANRVTESEILDRVASAFGIDGWPVTAVKAYVGHSLATASADQLISALGTFKYGILPGIKTIDKVADDVHQQRLSISNRDMRQDKPLEVCFINSKGFGGNNASGVVLSPRIAEKMLRKRHGQAAFAAYVEKREQTRAAARAYDQRALQGDLEIIYNFGQDLIDEHAIEVSAEQVTVPGFSQPLVYKKDARFSDMLD